MPFYDGLERRGIPHYVTRHESTAVDMAIGQVRISNQLGVVVTTTGPGACNTISSLGNAYRDHLPLLLITMQTPRNHWGRMGIQECSPQTVDTTEMLTRVTKRSLLLSSAGQVEHYVRHLLTEATTGLPGPVHLSVPADVLEQPISQSTEMPDFRPTEINRSIFASAAIGEAIRAIRRAKNPAILAGSGVMSADASEILLRLAELLRIPVATTLKGRVFPESHPLSLGPLGIFGSDQAKALLLSDEVDVLFVVGSGLGEEVTFKWTPALRPEKTLIHIDIDPTAINRNYPADIPIWGDAKAVLTEIHRRLSGTFNPRDEASAAAREISVRALKSSIPRFEAPVLDPRDGAIHPVAAMFALQECLPDHFRLFSDVGNSLLLSSRFLELHRPGSFFVSSSWGCLGHSCGAAVGAASVSRMPVFALMGDGAFLMSGSALHTATSHSIPVIFIVLNDGGFGMVRHGEQRRRSATVPPSTWDFPRADIAAMGRAMGARAFLVTSVSEIGPAIRSAVRRKAAAIVDIHVDPNAPLPIGVRA